MPPLATQWFPNLLCSCRQNLFVVLSRKLHACAKCMPLASLHTVALTTSLLHPSYWL